MPLSDRSRAALQQMRENEQRQTEGFAHAFDNPAYDIVPGTPEKYHFAPSEKTDEAVETAQQEEMPVTIPQYNMGIIPNGMVKTPDAVTEAAPRNRIDQVVQEQIGNRERTALEKMSERFRRGDIRSDMSTQMFEAAIGLRDPNNVMKRRQELLREWGEDKAGGDNFFSDAVYDTAEMMPAMGKGSLEGGVVAGGVAALEAMTAAPLTPVLTPLTTPVAFAIGSGQYWYRQGVGEFYGAMRDEGVSHEIASAVAQGMAVPYALIEGMQVSKMIPGFKSLLKKKMNETLAKTMNRVTVKYGLHILKESSEEAAQELTQIAAEEGGKLLSNMIEGTELAHAGGLEAGGRVAQSFLHSIGPMTLLMAPNMAISTVQATKSDGKGGDSKKGDASAGEAENKVISEKKTPVMETPVPLDVVQDDTKQPLTPSSPEVMEQIRNNQATEDMLHDQKTEKTKGKSEDVGPVDIEAEKEPVALSEPAAEEDAKPPAPAKPRRRIIGRRKKNGRLYNVVVQKSGRWELHSVKKRKNEKVAERLPYSEDEHREYQKRLESSGKAEKTRFAGKTFIPEKKLQEYPAIAALVGQGGLIKDEAGNRNPSGELLHLFDGILTGKSKVGAHHPLKMDEMIYTDDVVHYFNQYMHDYNDWSEAQYLETFDELVQMADNEMDLLFQDKPVHYVYTQEHAQENEYEQIRANGEEYVEFLRDQGVDEDTLKDLQESGFSKEKIDAINERNTTAAVQADVKEAVQEEVIGSDPEESGEAVTAEEVAAAEAELHEFFQQKATETSPTTTADDISDDYYAGRREQARSRTSPHSNTLNRFESYHREKAGLEIVPGTYEEIEAETDEQKEALNIAREFGQEAFFVRVNSSDPRMDFFNGAVHDGKVILNADIDADKTYRAIVGHEVTHRLKEESPKLYDRLKEIFAKDTDGFREYRENAGLEDMTDDELFEEYAADLVGERMDDPEFWRSLNRRNPTIVDKIRKYVRQAIEKVTGKKAQDHLQRVNDTIDQVMREFREQGGQKVNADFAAKLARRKGNPDFEAQLAKKREKPLKLKNTYLNLIKNIKELRIAAKHYFQVNLRNTTVNLVGLGEIQFRNSGSKKSLSRSGDYRKLTLFPYLPEIIKTSIKNDSAESYKGEHESNVERYYYLANSVEHDGEVLDLEIIIKQDDKGKLYYNHTIEDFDIKEKPHDIKTGASPRSMHGPLRLIADEVSPNKDTQDSKSVKKKPRFSLKGSTPARLRKEIDRMTEKVDPAEMKKLERHRKSTIIKMKIQALKKGYKLGAAEKAKELKALKREIVAYAREHLPKGRITRGQIGPVLTQIATAGKLSDVEEAFRQIETVHEKVTIKALQGKIEDLVKKYQPKQVNRRPEGSTLTADEYKKLHEIGLIMQMNGDEMTSATFGILNKAAMENREPTEEEEEFMYRVDRFGNYKQQKADELKQMLAELEALVEHGKSRRQMKEQTYIADRDMARFDAIDVITGGKGVMSDEAARTNGFTERIFSKFANYNYSLEHLLDKLSRLDKSSNPFQSRLNKIFMPLISSARNNETKGVREYHRILEDKLKEVYGTQSTRQLEKKLNDNTAPQETGITIDKGGEDVELVLSQNEAYKLWLQWQDPTLRDTMEGMGYDEDVMRKLEEFLTPEVKKWAEWQLNEFYPRYYQAVNAVFRERFHVDLPYNPFYTPIFRDVTGESLDDQLMNNGELFASVANGHLKCRIPNKSPLRIVDGDRVLSQHILLMEHFKAWAQPMRMLRGVANNNDVQKAIRQYHGDSAAKILNKMVNDIARGGVDRELANGMLDRVRSNFTKAVLGVNPVPFIKQMTSIPAYAAEIPVADFSKGMVSFMRNPRRAARVLMKSDMMKARYGEGFERDIKLALARTSSQMLSGARSITDALMVFTKLGDKAAILAGGWGVYKYHYDQAIKAGKTTQAADKIAMAEFESATKRSQQASDVEDLADIQRQGSWAKLFTMFMTSPNQYYRNEMTALRNLRYGRGSKAGNLKAIAIYHVVLPSLFQFVANGFKWDDKDQMRAAILGSLNGMLIVGDKVLEPLANRLAGIYGFGSDPVPVFQAGEKANAAVYKISQMIENDEITLEDVLKVMDSAASASSKVAGVPYDPVKRMGMGIYDYATGNDRRIQRLMGYSTYALDTESRLFGDNDEEEIIEGRVTGGRR